jgi:magnesium transporter
MNFANLPATQTSWGYWPVFALMAGICSLLYWRFRKLGWLQRTTADEAQAAPGGRGVRGEFGAGSRRARRGSSERPWSAREYRQGAS